MRRPQEIMSDERSMRTIVSLTSAFESLSSMQIIATKRSVEKSNIFFSDVWNIYKNIRVSDMFQFGRNSNDTPPINKELYIIITSQGSLSGDIDTRLIRLMRENYDPEKNDIIVIGRHGAQLLTQLKIKYKHYFTLPSKDPINIEPLVEIIKRYRDTRVFYQNYISLMTQEVSSLSLSEIVETKGAAAEQSVKEEDMITEDSYIFEPNPTVVVAHMEMSMMRLTLMQMVYNSRLAQAASRFKAMSMAKQNATDSVNELHTLYYRAKRSIVDTRLKEVAAGLKKVRASSEQAI